MEWLQQPPKRRSRSGLAEVVEKIDYLKSLGVADFELLGIRLERQQAYASRMRRRRPSRFSKLSEPRRSIELVCWLRVALMQFVDVALALSGMQTSTIERIARDNVRDEDAEQTTVLMTYIADASAVGLDNTLSDKEARERMLQVLRPGKQPLSSQAARVRQQLSSNARRTRPLLRTILKLPLQYGVTEPVGKAVVLMRKLYERNATTLPTDADISFAPTWAIRRLPDSESWVRPANGRIVRSTGRYAPAFKHLRVAQKMPYPRHHQTSAHIQGLHRDGHQACPQAAATAH